MAGVWPLLLALGASCAAAAWQGDDGDWANSNNEWCQWCADHCGESSKSSSSPESAAGLAGLISRIMDELVAIWVREIHWFIIGLMALPCRHWLAWAWDQASLRAAARLDHWWRYGKGGALVRRVGRMCARGFGYTYSGGQLIAAVYRRNGWKVYAEVNGSVWSNAPGGIANARGAAERDFGGQRWRVVASPWHPRTARATIRTPSHDLTDLNEGEVEATVAPLPLEDLPLEGQEDDAEGQEEDLNEDEGQENLHEAEDQQGQGAPSS